MDQHWCKLSTRFWDDARVVALREHVRGDLRFFRAGALFQVVLGLHREAEGDGTLNGHRATTAQLSHRLMQPEDKVEESLGDLAAAGLIERRGNGALRIVGWTSHWANVSGAALRMRKMRARKRAEGKA